MQVYQDKQVRIPHSKAIPKHEGMRKGYVTRYVPITHHLLPAITSTGRVCESKDAWTDNAMIISSSHAGTCERPGIYAIASLSDSDSRGVATDILGGGNLYMMVVEVQLPEDNKTKINQRKNNARAEHISNVYTTSRAPNITGAYLVQCRAGCEDAAYHQR
jgi:hypothetical protein